MSQVQPEEYGIFTHSVHLLGTARRAHERLDDGRPALQPGNHDDGLTAIFFSAAFLEAFLNELIAKAQGVGAIPGRDHSTVARFATIITEAENERATVRLRYQLARTLLSGEAYDKSTPPYEDFKLLFQIRDTIAHPPPMTFRFDKGVLHMSTDKLDVRLQQKKLAPKYMPRVKPIPGSAFTSRAVARWAINSAIAMAHSVLEALPAGDFRDRVRKSYDEYLVPISGPSSNDDAWTKEGITWTASNPRRTINTDAR